MPPKTPSRKSKLNPTIVVALIGLAGTIITALLASPVLIELIKKSGATETPAPGAASVPPDATLVFSEDFEDEIAGGFIFQFGDWEIVQENSNHVLKFSATGDLAPAAIAYFGPEDFADGVVEFRLMFIEWYGFFLDFRQQVDTLYVLELEPERALILLAVNAPEDFYALGDNHYSTFRFKKDVWYTIRLEARGRNVLASINGNQLISGSDPRLSSGRVRFALQPNAVVYIDDVTVLTYGQ